MGVQMKAYLKFYHKYTGNKSIWPEVRPEVVQNMVKQSRNGANGGANDSFYRIEYKYTKKEQYLTES